MTDSALAAAILADQTASALATALNDGAVAARMTAILPPTLVPTLISERGLYAAFADPSDALQVMNALTAIATGNPSATPPVAPNPVVAAVLSWLAPNNGGVDVSNASVIAMLEGMATAGAITAQQSTTIQALAQTPTFITATQVSRCLIPSRAS